MYVINHLYDYLFGHSDLANGSPFKVVPVLLDRGLALSGSPRASCSVWVLDFV